MALVYFSGGYGVGCRKFLGMHHRFLPCGGRVGFSIIGRNPFRASLAVAPAFY
ncbi:Protein of unknown function [Gryllus bimaculatus]|nr:Protein of unknown function [Gryllus bimaculatus]